MLLCSILKFYIWNQNTKYNIVNRQTRLWKCITKVKIPTFAPISHTNESCCLVLCSLRRCSVCFVFVQQLFYSVYLLLITIVRVINLWVLVGPSNWFWVSCRVTWLLHAVAGASGSVSTLSLAIFTIWIPLNYLCLDNTFNCCHFYICNMYIRWYNLNSQAYSSHDKLVKCSLQKYKHSDLGIT